MLPEMPIIDRDGRGAVDSRSRGRPASIWILLASLSVLILLLAFPQSPLSWLPSLTRSFATTPNLASAPKEAEPDYSDLFDHILFYLSNYYLDLSRAQPVYLLKRALSAMENAAEEIYVDNADPDKPFIRIHAGDKFIVRSLSRVTTIEGAIEQLKDIFNFLKSNYHGKVSLNEIRYATANGLLSGLDPHTLVFSPKAFKDFSVHIEGEIVGVGMLVGSRDGKLNVVEVLKGTPAQKAGFRRGDVILKIGEESTVNMSVTEAVQKIRGPRNTKVVLTIKRRESPNSDKMETNQITVTRDRVLIKSVESKLLPGNLGYVLVRNFDKNTVDSLKEHIQKIEKESDQKELAGLILDLRDNSGGLLKQAAEMADMFLSSGNLYYIADKKEVAPTEAEDAGNEPKFPMVVLCNQGSASGAEIVIGALQRNHRAVVLGSTTFGKGSVQQLHPLKYDAQIKITVSEYLIPDKISIQENGVVPDLLADRLEFTKKAIDLFPDTHQGTERDIERHIVSKYARHIAPIVKIEYPFIPPEEDPNAPDPFLSGDLKPMDDALVQIASKLLGIAIADGPGKKFRSDLFLASHQAGVEAILQEQYGQIVKLLKERGIDWSAPPDASASASKDGASKDGDSKDGATKDLTSRERPALELSLSHELIVRPPADEDDPYPEKNLLLKARLTNRSGQTIYRAAGISEADYFAYNEQEFLFGKLEPGQTIERAAEITLRPTSASRNDLFSVIVKAPGFDGSLAQATHDVTLQAEEFPEFTYSLTLLDAKKNSPITSLAPGTDALMKARIKNLSKESLKKGVALLKNEQRRDIDLEVGRKIIDDLKPGEVQEIEFKFQVREDSKEEAFKFEFGIVSSHHVTGLSREFEIKAAAGDGKEFKNDEELKAPSIALRMTAGGKEYTAADVLVTDQDFVDLCARIEGNSQPYQAWVTTALLSIHEDDNPDKIYFTRSKEDSQTNEGRPAEGQLSGKDCSFELRVPLKIGQNVISVVATNDLGLSRRKILFARREPVKTVKEVTEKAERK
ncbi:MAG: PDZ domain-containing protein [Planctomycetes bacterium]|nr:PDZ domain-containing protein [Planctomycetota bacterium]